MPKDERNTLNLPWILASILFVIVVAELVVLPIDVIDQQLQNEWRAVAPWLGIGEYSYSAELNDRIVPQAIEALMDGFARSPGNHSQYAFLPRLQELCEERISAVGRLLHLWSLRTGILLHWGMVFAPLLLISLCLGHWQRLINQHRYSFTSPYQLSISIGICKGLAAGLVFVFFFPWYIHPMTIPSLLACFAFSCGMVVTKLQKRI